MKVDLKKFSQIVDIVSGFAAKRDVIPALQYLFLDGGYLRTFSGNVGSVWATPELKGEALAVPAALLAAALRSLTEQGHIKADLDIVKKRLVLTAGKFEGRHPLLPQDAQFPKDEVNRAIPTGFVDLPADFWSDLKRVEFSVSKDETKAAFRGVFWSDDAYVSTDNFRMTLCTPIKKIKTLRKGGVLLPDFLLQLLVERSSLDKVLMTDKDIWFRASADESHFYSRLLEAEFPIKGVLGFFNSSRDIVEAKNNTGVRVELQGDLIPLVAVLDRLILYSQDRANKIVFTLTKDNVNIQVPEIEGSAISAEENVPATIVFPTSIKSMTFAVNAKYFRAALSVSSSFWIAEGKPLYFRSADPKKAKVEHLLTQLVV